MKIVINRCGGGFSLSEKAYDFLGLKWDGYGYDYRDQRTDAKLVECIETLGEEASGIFANLKVVEIPDDVNWEIRDDNGWETVEEVHRSWC